MLRDFEWVRTHVNELAAKRASLDKETERAQARRDTLANIIRKLEVEATTCNREFGVVTQGVRSLKELVAAGETCASVVKARAWKKIDMTSELC